MTDYDLAGVDKYGESGRDMTHAEHEIETRIR